MKLTRTSLACLFLCLTIGAAPASAQDTAARLTTSLSAIVAGDTNDARREAIVVQLRALGVDPMLERFGEGRGAGTNVVVTLLGTGARTILIGAHLDRVSTGRGAVDNGAGCAALIELIAAFKASPLLRSTLQVVFFDREENGLLGSRAYFDRKDRRTDAAINLDVFAYGDTIFATGSHPDGALVRALRAAGGVSILGVRDVPRNSYPDSDHITMMKAGIETLGVALVDAADVVGVLAAEKEGLKPGAGPRVLRIIHTPNDTMAEVRVDQMAHGIALVEQLIRAVD